MQCCVGQGNGPNESAEPLGATGCQTAQNVKGESEPERQAEAEDLCRRQRLTLLLNGAQPSISNMLPEDPVAAGQWTAF